MDFYVVSSLVLLYALSKKLQGTNSLQWLDSPQKKLEVMEGMSFTNINFSRYLQPIENVVNPKRWVGDNLKYQQVKVGLDKYSSNPVTAKKAENDSIYYNYTETSPSFLGNTFSNPQYN